MENFRILGLSEESIKGVEKKGFSEPTEIQHLTIPVLLNNEIDVIAQADTGTGKTLAFALPVIENIDKTKDHIQALILAPTRELVIQVCAEIDSLLFNKNIKITSIYGGQSIGTQIRTLKRGVSIVVGTPGRVLDLINRKKLVLDQIKYFILDEGDEMLNMGFIEDVEEIMEATPVDKRVLLFSATMPNRIKRLAEKYLGEYSYLKTKSTEADTLTEQFYYEMRDSDKFEVLCRIIDIEKQKDFYSIVFCKTKKEVDELSDKLSEKGYSCQGIHGDISQFQREIILRKFRKKHTKILVATDVAARGIDINDLSHVINYSIPQNTDTYTHRIGRTGRAGKEGVAITFITPSEFRSFHHIKHLSKSEIIRKDIPEVSEIINIKKKKISNKLNEIIVSGNLDNEYKQWSEELMSENNPEDLLASLLKYSFNNILDVSSYKEIKQLKQKKEKNNSGKRNQSRLFVSKGKKSNLNKKSIKNIIEKNTGISKNLIRDIEIFDNFSFIEVPSEKSDIILDAFKKKRKQQLIIKRAKGKNYTRNTSRKLRRKKAS